MVASREGDASGAAVAPESSSLAAGALPRVAGLAVVAAAAAKAPPHESLRDVFGPHILPACGKGMRDCAIARSGVSGRLDTDRCCRLAKSAIASGVSPGAGRETEAAADTDRCGGDAGGSGCTISISSAPGDGGADGGCDNWAAI